MRKTISQDKLNRNRKIIDRIFKIHKRVFKALLMVLVPVFIVFGSITATDLLLINRTPKVAADNIIQEYIPSIANYYSLNTDKDGNFYIHNSFCIMFYDANWNYKYSYVITSPEKARYVLTVKDDGLLLENAENVIRISFAGRMEKTKKDHAYQENQNREVKNKQGKTFVLLTTLCPRIIDESGQIVWHCSYFSFIAVCCCILSGILTFFCFVEYLIFSRHPSEVRPYMYFYH